MSKNVLVLTYWGFDDALIQTYTLPYVELIRNNIGPDSKLLVVTQEPSNPRRLELMASNKSDVYTLIPMKYTPFGFRAMFRLIAMIFKLRRIIKRNNIQTLHCWCTPAGAIGVLVQKIVRCELVIDSFEPHAENMVENGTWSKSSMAYKLLMKFEKKQARKAKHLIGLTERMKDYTRKTYGVERDDLFVKPSAVNLELFNPEHYSGIREQLGFKTVDLICVYAGKIGGIYLEDEIFRFWKKPLTPGTILSTSTIPRGSI